MQDRDANINLNSDSIQNWRPHNAGHEEGFFFFYCNPSNLFSAIGRKLVKKPFVFVCMCVHMHHLS